MQELIVEVATATASLATALLMFPLVRELADRFGQHATQVARGPAGGK